MQLKSRPTKGMFDYLESKGKMPKKASEEDMDHMHLPAREGMAFGGEVEADEEDEDRPDLGEGGFGDDSSGDAMHFADGGQVPEYNFDEQEGDASEYDSTGEPGTEHDQEDEQPMEFMARGGRVKKMAFGGKAKMPSPNFVKQMRMAR